MNVTVEARHFNARDELKEYVTKEVMRLSKFYDGINEIKVILDGKLKNKEATVVANVYGQQLVASETASTFEIAIESAVDKLGPQVMKYKEKLAKH